jgi:thiamine biosynthesis protein ThiS
MKTPPAPPQTASATDPCFVIANGQQIQSQVPCSIEHFLVAQKLLPRSVVVEHNGEAVAPSEFSHRQLHAGDRLEIVKIVAGG